MGGGRWQSGAARLCAEATLRAGAGLVTILAHGNDCDIYAAHLTTVMLKACDDAQALRSILPDKRIKAIALGPGNGVGAHTRAMVFAALEGEQALVLDADALSSFEGDSDLLWSGIRKRKENQGRDENGISVVLTPHEGEFHRIFPQFLQGSKLDRACAAAIHSGAVVVLKGADTVIADPGGAAVINAIAPPWLATAGSGDVLAGLILAQLTKGMPAFDAAVSGVYLHSCAAVHAGPAITAKDLVKAISYILPQL